MASRIQCERAQGTLAAASSTLGRRSLGMETLTVKASLRVLESEAKGIGGEVSGDGVVVGVHSDSVQLYARFRFDYGFGVRA